MASQKYASVHDIGLPLLSEEANGSDQALIDRFLVGDVDAFHDLMSRHEDRVFAICMRTMRDREAALDALQETFLTVFRKADRFSGKSAFSTWLYRVTVNTCYDLLRRQRRHDAGTLEEAPIVIDPAQRDQLDAVELRPDLEAALADLPDEFRAAVVLVDLEDLSLQDVSEILQVPVGTVKSRVFRGRRMLAGKLGNLGDPSVHPMGENDA